METRDRQDIAPVLAFVEKLAKDKLTGIEVVGRKLEQGPPVEAPVEVRLFGTRFDKLHEAAVSVAGTLEGTPGTRQVRHDLGPGAPTIQFQVDDAAASRYSLTRSDLARTLYGRTRGLSVGMLLLIWDLFVI